MERRAFLGSAGAVMGLTLAGCKGEKDQDTAQGQTTTRTTTTGSTTTGSTSSTTTTPTRTGEFSRPLPIPAELLGVVVQGRREFELALQHGTHEFLAGLPADSKGYNGDVLGPTLRARRGESIAIRVTNNLAENATTHWHGAHLPATADGGPHQVILPGDTWSSEWDVDQHACMIWYHPHFMGTTAEQVYAGLAGLFIIDDDERDGFDLPIRYGIDDIPIVVQDRRFTADGQLEYNTTMMDTQMGFQGDTMIVNGIHKPYIDVEAKQIRLRVLNGSNATVYQFGFSDNTEFQLIGIDCGTVEAPVLLNRITLSPGERAEIVVDLTDRMGESLRFFDADSNEEGFEITVSDTATVVTTVPSTLAVLDHLDENAAARVRPFVLTMGMGMQGGFYINGDEMAMNVINEVVPLGDIEIWQITNASAMPHNFHKHAKHFEILTRNGGAPHAFERGYKDTVMLATGETVRVIVQHTDYADDTHPYMYHCHFLEHEDQGMMGQFTVV